MTDQSPAIRPLVAGNWKMNGLKAALDEALAVRDALAGGTDNGTDVMICPPASLLMVLAELTRDSAGLQIGGQDCHTAASGAHTGDVSAEMLKDAGASAVIVGHSERRADHGELDRLVRDKALAARRAGLTAIVCIGESGEERHAANTLDIIGGQLAASVPDAATGENLVPV